MQTGNVNTGKREAAQQKLNTARVNLLLMIILTLVNIVLYFAGTDTMMLFSATIPYYAAGFGQVFMPSDVSVALFALAGALIITYFLCWLFSKKHYGWMIAALVLFVIDTAAMVYLYIHFSDISGILDVLVHAWVLYYLVVGVINGINLKKMPPEQPAAMPECPNADPEQPL